MGWKAARWHASQAHGHLSHPTAWTRFVFLSTLIVVVSRTGSQPMAPAAILWNPMDQRKGMRMDRKLLITVGDDPDCLYGVKFVGEFFRSKRDLRVTLLHVAPHFESMDADEAQRVHEMDATLSEIYARKGRKALEMSRTILMNDDFQAHQVTEKLVRKHYGMIGDMVEEARLGRYDAVVLGRRGYSIFEKSLHPWVCEATMDLELDLPIWVCRRPRRGLKGVLLCLDGSDPALRMAEHVARMVGKEEQHGVTLLHVDDGSSRDLQGMMDSFRRKLTEVGIEGERIRTLALQGEGEVAGTIREEAARGGYAVVAVGRRGIRNEGRSPRPFMGSKSMELLQSLEGATLWVGR